jgi:catechol 2,3-dioxygenase-like lactoylglutathione lyase family enzyme
VTDDTPPRPVGLNHVALEVGDLEAALEFYGTLFEVELRGRTESAAFVDMGDQFVALAEVEDPGGRDDHRHVGLVVDDPDAVERRLEALDAERPRSRGLEFRDPWGNRIQIVAYGEIQFTKAGHVLRAMGLGDLGKSDSALAELAEKGMAPDRE